MRIRRSAASLQIRPIWTGVSRMSLSRGAAASEDNADRPAFVQNGPRRAFIIRNNRPLVQQRDVGWLSQALWIGDQRRIF